MCGLALAPPAPLLAARPAPAEVGLRLVATAPARSPEYLPIAPSLAEVGLYSSAQLMATFAAKKPEIDPWIEDAEINGDRNLRPQYLAGQDKLHATTKSSASPPSSTVPLHDVQPGVCPGVRCAVRATSPTRTVSMWRRRRVGTTGG